MMNHKVHKFSFVLIFWVALWIGSSLVFWVVPITIVQQPRVSPKTKTKVAGEETKTTYQTLSLFVDSLAPAQEYKPFSPDAISAKSAILLDVKTGDILAAKNADEKLPIASLTKVITAAFLVDANFKKDALGTIYAAKNLAPYKYAVDSTEASGIKIGSDAQFAANDLLAGSLIASANNATFALVESQGYTPESFERSIASYLSQHDWLSTKIIEPTGLNPLNQSTAREFATIALHAFSYQDVRKLTSERSFTIRSVTSDVAASFRSTDNLLDGSRTILAGKTGYLDEAQYTFAVMAKHRSGRELLCVVFGAQSSDERFQDATKLLEWADASLE
jgi:D-alanyl-D-alanine endopeptidase (penicillin-binding protein 7)